MGLYKDPRTGQTKEFDTSSEAAGEGYFEAVVEEEELVPGMEDGEEISITPGPSQAEEELANAESKACLLYTSPSPRD